MVFPFSFAGQGTIRLARASDVPHLEWHGGSDWRSFYEERWHAQQSGAATLLVADWNDFPLGLIIVFWDGKASHPHFPDLQSLRVHPAFRGQSIGSKLLEAAHRLTIARGFAQVGLSVGVYNSGARRLYGKLGYQPFGDPYDETWSYRNAQGQEVPQTERVIDLVKELHDGNGESL